MLQHGQCVPSHFTNSPQVVQRFWPFAYLPPSLLDGLEILYFIHTPLQLIKQILDWVISIIVLNFKIILPDNNRVWQEVVLVVEQNLMNH